MTKFNLEPQYLFKLLSMPRGVNSRTSIGNRCNLPFYNITVDYLGNCFLCSCDGWLPLPVGQVQDFSNIESLLSSEIAKVLQKDVGDGMFSWCAVDHCGIRYRNIIIDRVSLSINIDESCNLHCPSCRRDPIMITSGPDYDKKVKDVNTILGWLEQYNDPIHITMSGNGDVLASSIMRPLVKNFRPRDQQTFTIFTNGLLIKKQINDGMPIFDSITNFKISVDAGSKEIYEDVRRPGKWEVLLENFDYLVELKKHKNVNLNFALQNKNYKDIPNFIQLCNRYGFRGYIHQLDDWGTWNQMDSTDKDPWTIKNGIFSDHDVLDPRHSNHSSCLDIISQNCNVSSISFSAKILKLINK
jgi:sulfatase maturation enzyme AslB (radical SAM superfamily)